MSARTSDPPTPRASDTETLMPDSSDASTSTAEEEPIGDNNVANNVLATSVHHDTLEKATEATLEPATFSYPPLPLQMIQGQAEDALLQEKRFKTRGGLEILDENAEPPLPLQMTCEDDISIQKLKRFNTRRKVANQPSNTIQDIESQSPISESQHDPTPRPTPLRKRPIFFPIEATPVTETQTSNTGREFRPSSITYAEPIADESKWKRLTKIAAWSLILIAVIIAVVVTAIIVPRDREDRQRPEPAYPKSFTSEHDCEVLAQGAFFDSDCNTCTHCVGTDNETTVITRDREEGQIQFFSNRKGSLATDMQLPRMYVQDIEVSKDIVALSDPWAGINRSYRGVVYLYERLDGKWLNLVNITPSNIADGAEFGSAVSIDEDLMVVSAPGDDLGGSVFAYRRVKEGVWVQEAKLLEEHPGSEFGSDVATKGNILVVSDEWVNTDDGAAFVYLFNPISRSWEYSETISNDDCADDRFGYTIALAHDHSGLLGLLVGCLYTRNETGAVYYYTLNDNNTKFQLSQEITTFNGLALPELGGKIFVDNDNFMAIGTGNSNVNGTVFIFTKLGNKWREVAAIDAPDTTQSFGRDTGISGDNILISSMGNVHSFQLNKMSCSAKKADQIY
eukprot:scaffold1290_cov112-Skeletonema_dohrnii-CCMP3373.AAC.12